MAEPSRPDSEPTDIPSLPDRLECSVGPGRIQLRAHAVAVA